MRRPATLSLFKEQRAVIRDGAAAIAGRRSDPLAATSTECDVLICGRGTMAHKINYNPHLARGYPETIEQQIRTTYQGQAHFANTGPFGATCAECGFLGYYRRSHNACGGLRQIS